MRQLTQEIYFICTVVISNGSFTYSRNAIVYAIYNWVIAKVVHVDTSPLQVN